MKNDKIWDIHDIGNRGKGAKNRILSRRESKCENSRLLFFIDNESLARGRNFSSRDAADNDAGRSSEVAEQDGGDEMHLAEGMVGMIRRL